jgi:hypothetical protein
MRKLVILFCILIFSVALYAQTGHEISGVVKDSTDQVIPGAAVILVSAKDSLHVVTGSDGIFIFNNVSSAQFLVTVKSLGHLDYNKRFLYNDGTKRIVLEPIVLKSEPLMLEQVDIRGTPTITYKQDTIEYRARDYKLRENATVEDLLKKMEGIEVDIAGTVTAQGTEVSKARLNGKDFSGGDVATAIQNLPADIVEKMQIIDDYGDEAARTGIKDGDSEKILNIVTKDDRSVGNIGRFNAGYGTIDRYNASVFANRLNGNQEINTILNFTNAVVAGTPQGGGNSGTPGRRSGAAQENGPATNESSSNASAGSGGISTLGKGSLGYRDDWNDKMKFNSSYSFNTNNTNATSNVYSEDLTNLGLILTNSDNNDMIKTQSHSINFDLEYEIDSTNYLRIRPFFNYNSTSNSSDYKFDQTGISHQINTGIISSQNTTPAFGGTILYQHLFNKPGRSLSFNLSFNQNNQQKDNQQDINILYYNQNDILQKDSLLNLLTQRENLSSTLRQSMTLTERLNEKSRIDFNAQINYRSYDNSAHTYDGTGIDDRSEIDSLANAYQYSFTETRLSLNYRRTEGKYDLSLGVTAIPTVLSGNNEYLNTSTQRYGFSIVPIVRFDYQFSRVHRLSLNYTGNATEPTFEQLQPVRDISNVNNPVIGNPNLTASFNHRLNFVYSNYIANSKLNYSIHANARIIDNSVVSSVDQIRNRYGGLINETSFLNMDGVSTFTTNYNISKSLADRKYSLRLNGSIVKKNGVSVSNDLVNSSKTWTFNQRFGPQINPNDWLELNPNIGYIYSKADYSLFGNDNSTNRIALNLDGKIYIQQTNVLTFNISKNYISGFNSSTTSNPLIINAALEKQLFKAKNGTLSLQVFDLLKQNNFIDREYTDQGFIDTRSNTLSRYFMISFRWILQKWTGTPSRNGNPLMRRGDGSFY